MERKNPYKVWIFPFGIGHFATSKMAVFESIVVVGVFELKAKKWELTTLLNKNKKLIFLINWFIKIMQLPCYMCMWDLIPMIKRELVLKSYREYGLSKALIYNERFCNPISSG